MNQKKYLLVSAGVHGALLLVLLILPSCFLTPKKPQPPALKINLQSSASIEAVLRQQTLQTTPTPPAPELVLIEPKSVKVEPPKPSPKPKPVPKPEKSRKKPAPAPQKPKIEPKKPPQTKPKKPEKIKIDFSKKIDRKLTSAQNSEKVQQQQREKAAQYQREAELHKKTEELLSRNSSGPSDIGDVSAGIALENWRQSVGESYDRAWQLVRQTEISNSRSAVEAKVVINLDGSVASAGIVQPSGVAELDDSVRDVLDRVRKIGKKPSSKTSIKDRTFTITFNLKDGRINTE